MSRAPSGIEPDPLQMQCAPYTKGILWAVIQSPPLRNESFRILMCEQSLGLINRFKLEIESMKKFLHRLEDVSGEVL